MNPNDVLIGIGYHLPVDRKSFHRDPEGLHTFFHQRRDSYQALLGDWNFFSDGSYPRCEDLAQAIVNSVYSQCIVYLNCDSDHLHFDPAEVQTSYETHIAKRLTRKQRGQLPRLADAFDQHVAQPIRFRMVAPRRNS